MDKELTWMLVSDSNNTTKIIIKIINMPPGMCTGLSYLFI